MKCPDCVDGVYRGLLKVETCGGTGQVNGVGEEPGAGEQGVFRPWEQNPECYVAQVGSRWYMVGNCGNGWFVARCLKPFGSGVRHLYYGVERRSGKDGWYAVYKEAFRFGTRADAVKRIAMWEGVSCCVVDE